MKKLSTYFIIALFPLLTACPDNGGIVNPAMQTEYTPLLMSRQQLENSIAFKEAQPVKNTGKIYSYGNYIFLNERYEGIHIIDNHNPSSPKRIAFIQAPGCLDFAVKNNILYLDNAVDLVSIDISDIQNMQLTDRITEVFPSLTTPPDGWNSVDLNSAPKGSVVVGWVKRSK